MGAITKTTHKNDQGGWGFLLTGFFLALFIFAVYELYKVERLPEGISFFDMVVITLAVFRLTRLVVYGEVFGFFRDFFIQKKFIKNINGDDVVVREKYQDGLLRNISDLLSCPWCIGMWLSLFVSFLFFLTPIMWFPIFVLAVAGLSSLIQITINLVGWRAEQLKGLVEGDVVEGNNLKNQDFV